MLKDIIDKRETITVSDTNSFTVGAITLESVVILISGRVPKVKAIFDELKAKGLMTAESLDPYAIGMELMGMAPEFVGDLIAIAANEPDQGGKVAQLPASVQLEALDAILTLTFEAEGGVKKFGETLVRLLQKGQQAFENRPKKSIQ